MGASESTGRLNEEEEERRRQQASRGGPSTGAAAAIAVATAGAVVAAWGISRKLSDTEEKDEEPNRNRHFHQTQSALYLGSGSGPPGLSEAKSFSSKSIWLPPPPNCFKMNTDGGFRGAELGKPSGYAGILRNHRCECIKTFRGYRTTGVHDSLEAEIVGILKGLELLVKLGLKGAILENDCDQAVLWINGDDASYDFPKERMAHCKEMILKCRTLARPNKIAVCSIDRDANKCANELCSLALKERNHQVQTDLPHTVKTLVDQDKAAYYRN